MNSAQPLPGFDLEATPSRPAAPSTNFESLQLKTRLCVRELKRAWHAAGRPPVHKEVKALFLPKDYQSNEALPTGEKFDVEDAAFTTLLEALNQIELHSGTKHKLWRFNEICQVMEQKKLFSHLRSPGLSTQCVRSILGKLLRRYLCREITISSRPVFLVSRGSHRSRAYLLSSESGGV